MIVSQEQHRTLTQSSCVHSMGEGRARGCQHRAGRMGREKRYDQGRNLCFWNTLLTSALASVHCFCFILYAPDKFIFLVQTDTCGLFYFRPRHFTIRTQCSMIFSLSFFYFCFCQSPRKSVSCQKLTIPAPPSPAQCHTTCLPSPSPKVGPDHGGLW